MDRTEKMYALAKEIYAGHGVDADAAMAKLAKIPISVHAWQGDDVKGFENTGHALTGGCQVTGNYPGCARTSEELRRDLDLALKLIPGTKRVCLQAHQIDRVIPGVDRDGFTAAQFSGWIAWAKKKHIGMDIAPVFYSHPKLDHGLSLSHPDPKIRKFWINHGIACRRIAETFGRELGTPCICNFWVPDGFKDIPADRSTPRRHLRDSLDACFAPKISPKFERDALEPKLFGIGTESCTVGSNEFYLLYAMKHGKMMCFDSGHFHPTESIADKLSSVFAMMDEVLLHISRGVHWDSDHVVLVNDELLAIARESVVYDYLDKIHFTLDYFDASINRIGAWAVGARNFQKALLIALLEPKKEICGLEKKWDFTGRMAAMEGAKTLPWGAVWEYFCAKQGVPAESEFMEPIRDYEKRVLLKRG